MNPQSNLHQKKVMGTVWWSAASLIPYSFLNPCETITSGKYAQESMRCTENFNTYSQQWSTERAQFFSMTTSNHTSHNQNFKSWMNWAMKFCLICHIHLTSYNHHFFKHLKNFWQGRHFYYHQEAENVFKEFVKSQSTDFYATGINTYFSLAKMCWL